MALAQGWSRLPLPRGGRAPEEKVIHLVNLGPGGVQRGRAWLSAPARVWRRGFLGKPKTDPHPRLQDFPQVEENAGKQRVAWRQESGGRCKFLAAGSSWLQPRPGASSDGSGPARTPQPWAASYYYYYYNYDHHVLLFNYLLHYLYYYHYH